MSEFFGASHRIMAFKFTAFAALIATARAGVVGYASSPGLSRFQEYEAPVEKELYQPAPAKAVYQQQPQSANLIYQQQPESTKVAYQPQPANLVYQQLEPKKVIYQPQPANLVYQQPEPKKVIYQPQPANLIYQQPEPKKVVYQPQPAYQKQQSAKVVYQPQSAKVVYQPQLDYQQQPQSTGQSAKVVYQSQLDYQQQPQSVGQQQSAKVAYQPQLDHQQQEPQSAGQQPERGHYDTNPQYTFNYDVQDGLTGDNKSQYETREGDVVKGSYSVIEADGTKRTVDYTADPKNGFNAVVRREPANVKAAAPVEEKVAYAPSAAPVHSYYNH